MQQSFKLPTVNQKQSSVFGGGQTDPGGASSFGNWKMSKKQNMSQSHIIAGDSETVVLAHQPNAQVTTPTGMKTPIDENFHTPLSAKQTEFVIIGTRQQASHPCLKELMQNFAVPKRNMIRNVRDTAQDTPFDYQQMSKNQINDEDFEQLTPTFSSLKQVMALRTALKKAETRQQGESQSGMPEEASKSAAGFDTITSETKRKLETPIEPKKSGQEEKEEKLQQELKFLRTRFCERSLNNFTLDNPIRYYCIKIVMSKWFDKVSIVIIALNSVLLGLYDYTVDRKILAENEPREIPFINVVMEKAEVFFTVAFTLETMIKIMASGFILSSRSYLRDAWNWLDLTVVITSLLQTLPFMQNMSVLRTFRLFRPLKSLSNVPSMKLMVTTLFNSLSSLSNILILLIYFIFNYALVGRTLLQGVLHQRCRQTKYPENGDWKVVEGDFSVCGAYHQCEIACGSLYNLLLPDENGVFTQYYIDESIPLNRDSMSREQNFGITNFDNIGSAFMTIFQCTTLEGWSSVMILIEDSFNFAFSAIFFITCIAICHYFILTITIAVMLDKFQREKRKAIWKNWGSKTDENEDTQNILAQKTQELKKLNQKKNINHIIGLRKKQSFWRHLHNLFQALIFDKVEEPPSSEEHKRYKFIICRWCYILVHIPLFHSVIMVFIVMNTLVLATDSWPLPEVDLIVQTNQMFTIIFTLELFVKIIGLTFQEWKKDLFNVCDFLIVFVSYLEMFLGNSQTAIVSTVRSIRLLRLIKLARSNFTLRCLLDSIIMTIAQCANFLVLLGIFMYVFALLGMEIFAERFKFNSDGIYDVVNGTAPRQNYDSIGWAIITVFQVLLGEEWNLTMYLGYQAKKEIAVLYFMVLVLFGRIILLNLFLAILLGSFEQASQIIREEQEKNIIEQFNRTRLEIENQLEGEDSGDKKVNCIIDLQKIECDDDDKKNEHNDQRSESYTVRNEKINTSSYAKDSSFNSSIDLRHIYEVKMRHNKLYARTMKEAAAGKEEFEFGASNQFRLGTEREEHMSPIESSEPETNREFISVNEQSQQQSQRPQLASPEKKVEQVSRQILPLLSIGLNKVQPLESPKVKFDSSKPEGSIELSIASESKFDQIVKYLMESSLLLFHKDFRIRKFMVKLTVPNKVRNSDQNNLVLTQISNLQTIYIEDSDDDDEEQENPENQADNSPISYILNKTTFKNKNGKENVPTVTRKGKTQLEKQVGSKMAAKQIEILQDSPTFSISSLSKKFSFMNWTINQWFENFIYLIIMFSMLLLIIDNPTNDPQSNITAWIELIDKYITITFNIEAICRIVALGFFTSSLPGKKGYIMLGSNQIDFFVCVMCDLLLFFQDEDIVIKSKTLNSFKVLRSVRALRLLRIINKSQGLKLAITSLFGTISAIFHGMIVCFLVIFIWAIIGISIFKGQFYQCINPKLETREIALIEDLYDCINSGGQWEKNFKNFDSIFSSMDVLSEIITSESWLQIMYAGLDATGINLSPKYNNKVYLCLYFISFLVIGKIFIMNLFVGIVIDEFNRIKAGLQGYSFMTKDQRDWIEAEKLMCKLNLIRKKQLPKNAVVVKLFHLQNHKYFVDCIDYLILASLCILGQYSYQMNSEHEYILNMIDTAIIGIYNLEALIKIISLDNDYFTNMLDLVDFFIVIANDAALIMEIFVEPDKLTMLKQIVFIMKVVKCFRLFRVLRRFKSLRVLIDNLIAIVPLLGNVMSLIMLMFFIFAIIGMNMFPFVKFQLNLNENNNFQSFGNSFILLVRCATGEKWNMLMWEAAVNKETIQRNMLGENAGKVSDERALKYVTCVEDQTYEDYMANGPQECGTMLAFIYFGLFVVFFHMIMLNLFMAVILDGFRATNMEHNGAITSDMLDQVVKRWVDYDPRGTGWINVKDVIFLVCELDYPLGKKDFYESQVRDQMKIKLDHLKTRGQNIDKLPRFVIQEERNMIMPFSIALDLLRKMQLPVYTGQNCHFRDVVKRIVRDSLQLQQPHFDPKGISLKQLKMMEQQWANKYPDLETVKPLDNYDSGKLFAGLFIVSNIETVHSIRRFIREENINDFFNQKTKNANMLKLNKKLNNKKEEESKSKQPGLDANDESPQSNKPPDFKSNLGSLSKPEVASKKLTMAEEVLKDHLNYIITQAFNEQLQKIKNNPGATTQDVLKYKDQYQKEDEETKHKDYERSTWWMADERKNVKMRRWLSNLEFKEEQVRFKSSNLGKKSRLQKEKQSRI